MGRIKKLLIANRGEIACRVISTCQRLGIQTVAVYSEADKKALHVEMADEAVFIGPAPAQESYLNTDKIIDAAKKTGANAIHPGYGFLSENPEFSEACAQNGIIFVGPSADSMRAMALKGSAKKLMEEADVPVVPGYHGDDQSPDTLAAEAERIGYPVLIKAVAGGGGKGMRKVFAGDDVIAAIEAAKREGENAFGNGKLLIEKLIEVPRHIEIQIFGDSDGNAVHLFERDCSLQRRHQKVVEEAPAPGMSAEMRYTMGEAAVRAAEAINYQGAGTVEFIVDVSGGLENAPFYFMEMNTRLQVEHPVTELITGQDLVEWQLMIAEGHPLPLSQEELDLHMNGHAVEVRLYAEDPYNGFLPSIGDVGLFDPFADTVTGGRIDAGVRAGDAISIHYDPMIGKLIAWGETRDEAIETLLTLLRDTPVTGLRTNRDFLIKTLDHQAFRRGYVHTGFIGDYETELLAKPHIREKEHAIAAFAIIASRHQSALCTDPWDTADSFRLNLPAVETLTFETSDGLLSVNLVKSDKSLTADIAGKFFQAEDTSLSNGVLTLTFDGLKSRYFADIKETEITLVLSDNTVRIMRHAPGASHDDEADGPGTITAPMPGKILAVKVENGTSVSKGDPLLVMEAMKMEQTISAPRDGVVTGLALRIGEQVTDGTLLLTIADKEQT